MSRREEHPIEPPPGKAGGVRSWVLPIAAVLLLTGMTAALAVGRRTVPWNADGAVVGLMARDILRSGHHPVFFDGSDYAGTFEQHWVALAFGIFGESVAVHRAAVTALLVAVVGVVFATTRLAFGPAAALAAGLYLALGPHFFYYRGVSSEGPYTPVYLAGAGILLLLVLVERRARDGQPIGGCVAGLGFLGGVGWWTHPLSLAFGISALVALAVGTARRRLTIPTGMAAVAAFAIGSLPWWIQNLRTSFRSLTGPDLQRASLDQALHQAGVLFGVGIPTLLGGRPFLGPSESFPGATILAYGLLVGGGAWGVHLLRARRGELQSYTAAILLPLLVACPALALNSVRTGFAEPRLIFPYYFVIAPLLGSLLTSPRFPVAARGIAAIAALALAVRSHALAPVFEDPPVRLVQALEARGVTAFYGSYWKAYTVTFLSRGAVVGTPFGASPGTRRLRDAAFVDASPAPAVLLGPEEAGGFDAFLSGSGFASRREVIEGFVLYRDLPPEALAALRGCLCVPPPASRVVVPAEGVPLTPSGAS